MNDTCGCCGGIQALTPEPVANRPGLQALAYRFGTHAAFLETMKARLSNFITEIQEVDDAGNLKTARIRPLLGLTTRAANDPAIALLDAWATLADVLTFYQERIANEGYLRTATERRSILELARLIGYTLRPGVASTVYLAYTLDANAKDPVIIPIGTRSQSVPGPGELPQSFETVEQFEARAAWNLLQPRMTRPQTADAIRDIKNNNEQPRLYLKGISANLKPNDPLLIDFADGAQPVLYRVVEVTPDPAADRTLVRLQIWHVAAKAELAMVGPEAITADTKRQIDDIIERFLGEEADRINLSRVSQMFKSVSGELGTLRQLLVGNVTFPEMFTHLNRVTISQLEGYRQTAQKNHYTDLEPWLTRMLAELSSAGARASIARAEALAREFTFVATPTTIQLEKAALKRRSLDPTVMDEIKNPLSELVKVPSVPPRNKFVLKRDVATEFKPKADTNLQIFGTFRAEIREDLPTVLENTKVTPGVSIKAYTLRVKAAMFGYNAPQKVTYNDRGIPSFSEWTPDDEDVRGNVIFLDNAYDQILPGQNSYIVVQKTDGSEPVAYNNFRVTTQSRTRYNVSAKTTKITLPENQVWWNPGDYAYGGFDIIRETTIFAQSEELTLAEEPIEDPVCGSNDGSEPYAWVELDGVYSGLQSGRWLIVSGERTDIQTIDPDDPRKTVPVPGVRSSELVMLSEVIQRISEADKVEQAYGDYGYGPLPVPGEKIHTFIRLARKLEYCYKRNSVKIYGNVVKATHGETRNEVLGSGDATLAFQSFVLKQPPLTHVAAPITAGAKSTLQVRVNEIEWHEKDSLAGLEPTDHNFITRTNDDSKTTVIFSNGQKGARPPTGVENIKAVYRNGIGKAGNVKAEQISMLVTRPLGVKDVINPLRASGGADKENLDQARKNAPLAILALDRLVSTQDYADFARTFAGIGKASAARLTDGSRQLVHVTIAGAEDIPIDRTSDLYMNLVKAMRDYGDPFQPIRVDLRELVLIVLSTNIRILPDYQWEAVATQVRDRLQETFSFERRELGQDVLLSEVIMAIQSVDGVLYVDVDMLGGVSERDETGALRTPQEIGDEVQRIKAENNKQNIPKPRVQVNMASVTNDGSIRPAQLAFLTPEVEATLILNEVKL